MVYTLEEFISKIHCPVTLKFADAGLTFSSGMEAMATKWPVKLQVISITSENNQVVLKMDRVNPIPIINWVGEEPVSFF